MALRLSEGLGRNFAELPGEPLGQFDCRIVMVVVDQPFRLLAGEVSPDDAVVQAKVLALGPSLIMGMLRCRDDCNIARRLAAVTKPKFPRYPLAVLARGGDEDDELAAGAQVIPKNLGCLDRWSLRQRGIFDINVDGRTMLLQNVDDQWKVLFILVRVRQEDGLPMLTTRAGKYLRWSRQPLGQSLDVVEGQKLDYGAHRTGEGWLCGLTFELSCPRRQTALGRGRHDATGAWSGQATAAVAGQLERGVRPHAGALQFRFDQAVPPNLRSVSAISRASAARYVLPAVTNAGSE